MPLGNPKPEEIPRPDPVQERVLLVSEVARDERRAEKLGALSVDFAGKPRGRQRSEVNAGDQLFTQFSDEIPSEEIIAFAKEIQPTQPLFGKFTKHYHISPNSENIGGYITAANTKNKRYPNDSRTREQRRNDFLRQTHHIFDLMQRGIFDDRNIARVRRTSLKATRYLIAEGLTLDESAAKMSASAIEDFGHTIIEQDTDVEVSDAHKELAAHIISIGERAAENPEILRKNPMLLKLVQIEQKARDEYWSVRFEATEDYYFGNRLTKEDKQNGIEAEIEIERLNAIVQN